MSELRKVVFFDDGHPLVPDGAIFYPLSLSLIRNHLGELISERMEAPGYFNANIEWILGQIVDFFVGIHRCHERAKEVHASYRSQGHQYGVYLRSYALAGGRFYIEDDGAWSGQDMFSTQDYRSRVAMRDALAGRMNCISFVNPFSVLVPASASDQDMPLFRLLDHNWKSVVEETLKGCNFVVLNLSEQSDGIAFEQNLIQTLGLGPRTILVLHDRATIPEGLSGVHTVVEWDEASTEFVGGIQRLSDDAFRQVRPVADLSTLPCHVVDKNIGLAIPLVGRDLTAIAYDDYVPSSLRSNWNIFVKCYPDLVRRWCDVERQMTAATDLKTAELAAIMYLALTSFVTAVTLERYSEMAQSIAILGITHRFITREWHLMIACYEHAATFLDWSIEAPTVNHYREKLEMLRQEQLGVDRLSSA